MKTIKRNPHQGVEPALPFTDNDQDVQERVWFPNGRGVSIIRNQYSYGGARGLFEVAVIQPVDGDPRADWDFDYTTPVTNNVEGWKNVAGVLDMMKQVHDLPAMVPAIEAPTQQVIE